MSHEAEPISRELQGEDRGKQRRDLIPWALKDGIVIEPTGRLTKGQVKETLFRAAIKATVYPPQEMFETAAKAIEAENEHGQLFQQLSRMGTMNSIVVPASAEILDSLSKSAAITYRTSTTHKEAKAALVQGFVNYLEGDDYPGKKETAITTIRALRNLAIIGHDITRQLLSRIQFVGNITFEGLKELFEGASQLTRDDWLTSELGRAGTFISASEKGVKRTLGIEDPETVRSRVPYLSQAVALLAQEHIENFGSSQDSIDFAAHQLVTTCFAHQIHWVDPKKTAYELCEELLNPSIRLENPPDLSEVAAQFLLQAQLAGLIDPPSYEDSSESVSPEDYQELGLQRFFTEHQRQIQERQPTYIKNPLPFLEKDTSVLIYSGWFGSGHLGYNAFLSASINALKLLYPDQRWQIVVSMNLEDAKREESEKRPGSPPALTAAVRVPFFLNNLSGIIDNEEVILTSIEHSVGPKGKDKEDFVQRLISFSDQLQRKNGSQIGRLSGFDRTDVSARLAASLRIDPLLVGLRHQGLRRILRDPDQLRAATDQLPATNTFLLLLSGVSAHSSSDVFATAKKYLKTKSSKQLWKLQSRTHRRTWEETLEMVSQVLKEPHQEEQAAKNN